MTYRVQLTPQARADLQRLFRFLLERELARDGGDEALPDKALEAIGKAFGLLEFAPFTCRKAASSPFLRELLAPFGHAGYVVLFEVMDAERVLILAARHQLEDDYFR